jgi:hypothetical protein
MLTILGKLDAGRAHCDGLSRRDFLKIGGMAAGGLSLPQLLAIEAAAGAGRSEKSLINIFLPGGPSHIDFFDMKPDAPAEIRGELQPIATNVPGIEICELFPLLARMADKFTILRSIVGSEGLHDGFQCMTGRMRKETAPAGGWPMLGSWVSRVKGPVDPALPANVALMYPTGHREWGDPYTAGFIGPAHAPLSLVAKDPMAKAKDMALQGITLERLSDRQRLLTAVDRFRRYVDESEAVRQSDAFTQQALGILTSSRLMQALDLTQEEPRLVERYGKDNPVYLRDGAPRMVRNFLIARRLVEAGVRVVSMNFSRWDWHGPDGMNFPSSREEAPLLDQALSALIADLHDRGLDEHVAVIVWGEFGRTPKLNKHNSRDHWPAVTFALLFGGGMRTGQVIGATNRLAEFVVERPVTFQDVFATLYQSLGIDVGTATVVDLRGRPQYLVDSGARPIPELI